MASGSGQDGAPAVDAFEATYRPDAAVIADARGEFAEWMDRAAPGATVRDEMLVVLSELLANAVSASTDSSGAVGVRAWIGDGVTLEVTDPADAVFDLDAHWDYDDPLRPGGRGLLIVESLVDDLAITPPSGLEPLRVRCRRSLAPA